MPQRKDNLTTGGWVFIFNWLELGSQTQLQFNQDIKRRAWDHTCTKPSKHQPSAILRNRVQRNKLDKEIGNTSNDLFIPEFKKKAWEMDLGGNGPFNMLWLRNQASFTHEEFFFTKEPQPKREDMKEIFLKGEREVEHTFGKRKNQETVLEWLLYRCPLPHHSNLCPSPNKISHKKGLYFS